MLTFSMLTFSMFPWMSLSSLEEYLAGCLKAIPVGNPTTTPFIFPRSEYGMRPSPQRAPVVMQAHTYVHTYIVIITFKKD